MSIYSSEEKTLFADNVPFLSEQTVDQIHVVFPSSRICSSVHLTQVFVCLSLFCP